ncbi:MAG: DUF5979 domain-containing protein, partial [Intestinibaculum porci]|uniref:DUF7601 domain-containing protein n=1 Tax=Intestinibaculum porci TaxID=2487118 RepID=UPI0024091C92
PGAADNTGTIPVYEGVDLGTSASTATATISAQEIGSNQSSVTANTTIDFSNVKWPQTGIYRYNVKNTDSATAAYSGAGFGKIMQLDVAVVNDSTGKGYQIDHAALVDTEKNKDGTTSKTKSSGFEFNYYSKYMKFTKIVAGNQGDHNKEFKFTLNISGAAGLDKLSVQTSSTSNTKGATKSGDLVVNDGSTGNVTFYLKHNDYVIIDNLPAGYNFTLSEDNEALKKDGYTASIPATTESLVVDQNNASASSPTGGILNSLSFNVTNTKDGTVPTGVIFAVAPFAIGAVAIAAFVILKVRKAAKQ